MSEAKKIKVLFRHRSMEMGGVEKVLLSMLNNLDKNKFDIRLALNLLQGELRNEIPKNIPVKILAKGKEDMPKNALLNKLAMSFRGIKLLIYRNFPSIADNFILKNDADVEIATGYTMFSDLLNSSNKKSIKIGWFHSDITFPKLQPAVPLILKQIPQFDYFIFGSQQTKDILLETYPNIQLPENKVILNAIPIEELKQKAAEFKPDFETKHPVFVTVGRLHSRKGHHKLMDAHAQLLKDDFPHKIFVIGDGEEKDNLENQAKKLGVEDTFKLLGSLLNPYPYVKNADFFIMPSESEGWPLIIADTLILQKPIISTNVGGIPEMIEHHKNGYLIKYSTEEIYEAMKKFLTDKNLVSEIQENLKDSEKQFDNQKIFDAVEEIILKLAKK
ncbi:glycosyltransferase [uncultured Chryseobacterium sp.]|uniref:glycosyltransferase n=1 Tax=uncultured Chryseobacterium sp. TaxID=259322 RepID=UPI002626D5A9|nr:glycosyltransferase [uncultured Chryseobacterium sp.]